MRSFRFNTFTHLLLLFFLQLPEGPKLRWVSLQSKRQNAKPSLWPLLSSTRQQSPDPKCLLAPCSIPLGGASPMLYPPSTQTLL